jgi:ATP-dependent Clp protease protease subunit
MLETAQRLEKDGFAKLRGGSRLSVGELFKCAATNCYMSAADAWGYGLIGDVLG